MWGLLTVLVDSLIPRIKEIFELSYFQAGFVQFFFFTPFLLISIPSGNLLHKIGYKKGIILGLIIIGLGCLLFLPAASFRSYGLFLLGYFILASGITILQVAANPYVTVLGDERTASSRLNLSQAFNSLGTAIAPIIGAIFILSDNIKTSEEIQNLDIAAKEAYFANEASAVQTPRLILAMALIVLAIIVSRVNFPKLLGKVAQSNYRMALKHKKLKLGALGIFLYVGAEVAIGSYLVSYFLDLQMADAIRNSDFMRSIVSLFYTDDLATIDNKGIVGAFVTFYWLGAMVGRFIGSVLTTIFQPNKVLAVFATLAMSCLLITMSSDGLLALWSVIAVGLFNSIMFPTIFSISIEDLGDLKPEGSGVLCTAIVGGAIIPPLYGYLTDVSGFKIAFLLVILCYLYIAFFAKKSASLHPA